MCRLSLVFSEGPRAAAQGLLLPLVSAPVGCMQKGLLLPSQGKLAGLGSSQRLRPLYLWTALGTAVPPAESAPAWGCLHASASWAAVWVPCWRGSRLLTPAGAAAWRSAVTGCLPAGAEGKWGGSSHGHAAGATAAGRWRLLEACSPSLGDGIAEAAHWAQAYTGGSCCSLEMRSAHCIANLVGACRRPRRGCSACCPQAALRLDPLCAHRQSLQSHLWQLQPHAASGVPAPSRRCAGGRLPEWPGEKGSGWRRHQGRGRLLRQIHSQAGRLQGRSWGG